MEGKIRSMNALRNLFNGRVSPEIIVPGANSGLVDSAGKLSTSGALILNDAWDNNSVVDSRFTFGGKGRLIGSETSSGLAPLH